MDKRLFIITTIIFLALTAFCILGFHSISLHADGLAGKRIVEFSEVAEQIRIDVKQKLDKFIQTEQKRPYTDYQYIYTPDAYNNDGNLKLRSPLAVKMKHGMAYGYFQIQPDGNIVSPFYITGQTDQLDEEKKTYVSNIKGNVLSSLTIRNNGAEHFEIQRIVLNQQKAFNEDISTKDSKTGETANNIASAAKAETIPQKKQLSKSKRSANARGKNYTVNSWDGQTQQTQILNQSRQIVSENFADNTAASYGGGIQLKQTQAAFEDSQGIQIVSSNQAQTADEISKIQKSQKANIQQSPQESIQNSAEYKQKNNIEFSGRTSVIVESEQQGGNIKYDLNEKDLSQTQVEPAEQTTPPQDFFDTYGRASYARINMQAPSSPPPVNTSIPARQSDMVQIRIEPFVPIVVSKGANPDSYFNGQVFLLRHIKIEDQHFLQGFKLNEDELVEQVMDSARSLKRTGMEFKLSKTESDDAAHAAILDFGFGNIVLNLFESNPERIAGQVSQLKNWYFTIISIVMLATLIAMASLWRNVRAQTKLARKKDDFISAVSHELRTPLTTIRMYTEMLEKKWVATESKRTEYYATMRQESERLSRLIENVLDFSRIQRGRKTYNFTLGDINTTIKEVVDTMAPCAAQKGFTLEKDFDHSLTAVSFDSDAIMQIVINLIDNAIKYAANASDRSITIRTQSHGNSVIIEVEDHGPGIPHLQRKKIFDEFYRIGEESKRETTGTGLGLALVKKFTQAHDGIVEIITAKPKGALFRITLPLSS